MKNRIIYDCFIGPPVFGIITADDILHRRAIFSEQIKNLIGFRTYFPVLEEKSFIFYEVGHFMELLYNGSPEAFTILNMSEDYVEQSTHEIRILKDSKDKLVSKAIPKQISDYVLGKIEAMVSGTSYFSDEKSVSKLGYDKEIAYICSLYLRLAKDVLITEKFKVEREDAEILTAIKEGRFSKETIVKEIEAQLDEVIDLTKESKLPPNPSKDLINELLFKIRDVEMITETERIR